MNFNNFVCHPEQRAFLRCQGSEGATARQPAKRVTINATAALLALRAGEFLLGRGSGACEDAEDFVFLHDDEVFAINLDLGTGILSEQDAVVVMNGQREGLAFIVGAAFSGGNYDTLLRLVFCAVRDNDAASSGGSFLHATDEDAVMQWAEFRHGFNSFQKLC